MSLCKSMILRKNSWCTWLRLHKHFKRFIYFSTSTKANIKDESMSKIRNIGIMAHIDAGKTTTSERMLFYSGFSRHLGDVDDGDTIMDYMEQERERGITITSAAITFHWNKHKINLIDTPGHVDFTVEVDRCLRVLDGAVTVLDASAGVEAQTLTVWRQAENYEVPSIVYLNKMDKPKANVNKCLKSIQDKLKIKPLLINFPILSGNKVTGIVDIINMEKITYDFEKNSDGHLYNIEKFDPKSNSDLWEMAYVFRNNLVGHLADLDEKIADHVLSDNQNIPTEEINAALRKATIQRQVVPVLCGSALKNAGIQPLLDAITHYLPSPTDRTYDFVQFYESDLCAFAFKVIHDKHRRPLTFFRLYSGIMQSGSTIYNINKDCTEKASRLINVYSDEYHDVNSASAGNIICVAGLKQTQTSDTITTSISTAKMATIKMHHHRKQQGLVDNDQDELPVLAGITVLPPVFLCSVEAPSMSAQKNLELALACMQREDPSLSVQIDEQSGQTILGGMGELHLEIIKQRLLGEYKLDVYMGPLQVAYKETIENEIKMEESLERVLAERKQHVVIKLSLHSNNTSKQFKHVKLVKTREEKFEHLHHRQLKAIDIGIQSTLSHGPILNFPVIDLEVRLHKVEIGSTTTAAMISACAAQCVQKALKETESILLEPMMNMEITTDEDNLGVVLNDLAGRRSQIENIESKEEIRVVHAVTPLAETMGYSTDLRTITHGIANFTMELSHYEKMTPLDQKKVVQKVTGFS